MCRSRFSVSSFFVISIVTFFLGGLATLAATPPAFLWAKQAGGTQNDYVDSISVDTNGNFYAVGQFTGAATFGSTNLTATGGSLDEDIFIVKYDASGNVVWARRAGGPNTDEGFGVKLDRTGTNLYVTGKFSGTASFGTTNLTSSGVSNNMFLAKYDTSGNFIWATNSANSAYVVGNFHGTATFGTTNLTARGTNGYRDIFVAKYNSAGTFQWVQQIGGPDGEDDSYSIAVDASNNVYVTGWFLYDGFFGPQETGTLGIQDIFLAKYDSAGNFLWMNQAGGGNDYQYSYAVAVQR